MHILTVRDSVGVDHLDEIHVIGGNCLKGSITVQGSKNTVLPIMAASSSVCAEKPGCDNFRKKRKNSGRLQKAERAGDKFS